MDLDTIINEGIDMNDKPIRVIELFAGIGSQAQALKNLQIPHKIIAISEIDATAIKGYTAIHGPTNNLGDITKIEHLPPCDLLTYSFPCQDLSIAGNKEGMAKGQSTRSSLLWEVERLLIDMKERKTLPEVLLMENVDAILNHKNSAQFNKWIVTLNEIGYRSSYSVVNAKDCGIPQNRKRCFMVSTLTKGSFIFPDKVPLEKHLIDYLEPEVDDSYYLTPETIAKFNEHLERNRKKGNNYGWRPYEPDKAELSYCITTDPLHSSSNYLIYPEDTKKGYAEAREGDGVITARPHKARETVQKQTAPTLTTTSPCNIGVVVKWPDGATGKLKDATPGDGLKIYPNPARYNSGGTIQKQISNTINTYKGGGSCTVTSDLKIRYLTPRECLRLMAFRDEQIDRLMEAVPVKSKLYKLAGNSIVVSCLEAIFSSIYIKNSFEKPKPYQKSLLSFEEVKA